MQRFLSLLVDLDFYHKERDGLGRWDQRSIGEKRRALTKFVGIQMPNVGTHPFLVGLQQALKRNAESTYVVAWKGMEEVCGGLVL